MAVDRVQIASDRYIWAIQRAGYSMDTYINKHPKITVSKWINGEKQPTIKQLEDFAKSVNVPFGFLFLPTTPQEEIPFPMFRGNARIGEFNLNVYDTVVKVAQKQDWLEDYLKENDIEICPFVATMSIKNSVQEVVVELRKILNLNDTWAFSLSNSNEAVNKLSNIIEDVGVFLTYNGVVGNNVRRQISVQDCRGFALVNKIAPYIFINNSDSKSAQLFTLIHELAHILVGISAGYAGDAGYEHDYTEKFCDQVAAEFLVPSNLLKTVWDNDGIPSAAKKFKVSELVIARRAHDIGLIDSEQYRLFYLRYTQRRPADKKTSGGDYYRTSVKRVGRTFAIHVRNAVNGRQLSYTEAYRLTGLYGQTYDQFMKKYI
jgi:Zn-dependent peptidase ImmA (M78 family)